MKKFTSLFLTLMLFLALVGCGADAPIASGNDIYANEERHAQGTLEDIMHTYFFDFVVHSAYICESYENYIPGEGKDLLVADITIKNTFSSPITIYDLDFQVQWNDDAEDAFDVPITYYVPTDKIISEELLPYECELKKNAFINKLLVFEVPEGKTDFSISYLEYFEDYTYGDVHFVFFSAEKQ